VIEVVVVAEGQTEETFVRDVLAPELAPGMIFLSARLVGTSPTQGGGALSYPRVQRYLRNTLRERSDTYVTTFFDLYRLDTGFPGADEAAVLRDPPAKAGFIESRFRDAVVEAAACREERFLAHIQPYEFEGLLFSDVPRLVEIEPGWRAFAAELNAVRTGATSPEHIDDGPDTHPSARLSRLLRPRYQKALHGPRAALRIGLAKIAQECAHFGEWLDRLRQLQPLAGVDGRAS